MSHKICSIAQCFFPVWKLHWIVPNPQSISEEISTRDHFKFYLALLTMLRRMFFQMFSTDFFITQSDLLFQVRFSFIFCYSFALLVFLLSKTFLSCLLSRYNVANDTRERMQIFKLLLRLRGLFIKETSSTIVVFAQWSFAEVEFSESSREWHSAKVKRNEELTTGTECVNKCARF